MSGVVFDTSVYIWALRQGDASVLSLRRAARGGEAQTRPLWLSAVVLEELYVGAVNSKARLELQRLEREFVKIGRLLVPDRRDWAGARQILGNIGRKYGFSLVTRSRLANDALIAVSVAGRGFTVQTKNPGDFALIAEFRPFDWQQI